MTEKAADFFEYIKSKRVAFIGTGVSHQKLIKMFLRNGVDATLCDKKSAHELGDKYDELSKAGAKFELGETYLDNLEKYDIVFRTPGMYFYNEKLTQVREKGVVVTSEMEVFFDLCPCRIYAVTGSDGKTTTTTLISEMLQRQGITVHKGGNIGKALLPEIENIKKSDAAVVELSSFQLISMRRSPDVAVITNVAPNHLDVHKGGMPEYIDAKKNIIAHQGAFTKAVLNFDNEITRELSGLVRGELEFFSRKQKVKNGIYLSENGDIIFVKNGSERVIMNKSDIKLPGIHNVENYMTAAAAVAGEVSDSVIVDTARSFNGVEHRIEYVRTVDGVKYYNDSIATSPTRTIAGLNSFDQKIIVIAGGYDKKIPYEPLAPYIVEKVKTLILMGATADKIEAAVKQSDEFDESGLKILRAQTMEQAVELARESASEGDVVTLSPASASFDKYPNFEERGKHYKNIVNSL